MRFGGVCLFWLLDFLQLHERYSCRNVRELFSYVPVIVCVVDHFGHKKDCLFYGDSLENFEDKIDTSWAPKGKQTENSS